jgi:hypothetical protein
MSKFDITVKKNAKLTFCIIHSNFFKILTLKKINKQHIQPLKANEKAAIIALFRIHPEQ